MTYVLTQAGFMQLQDSPQLLRKVFPNYLELQPCNPVPVLEVPAAPSAAPSARSHEGKRRPYFAS